MEEPLEILLDFNPFNLAYKFISCQESQTIKKEELDNNILFQYLYFSKLYNSLELSDKQLVKAKFNLNGKVYEAHLGYGKITLGDDIHLYSLYKQELIKVSHHKYFVANLMSSIYSIFTDEKLIYEDAIETDKSIQKLKESIIKIENKAIPELPIDFVFEKLQCLTYNIPKLNEQYLSHQDFEAFIRIGFGLEPLPKVTVNIPPRHIGAFIRVFHNLYDKGCHKYSLTAKLAPFISLIKRSFTNFNEVQIKQNLRHR